LIPCVGRLRRREQDREDRGVAAVWVLGTGFGLLVFAGFLADGIGVVLKARSEAFSIAGAAARSGAQALDDAAAVRGDVRIDPEAARAAASRYLAARDIDGDVTVFGDEVSVTVHEVADLNVFPGSVTIDSTATAHAIEVSGP
jgi:hypothetical protein